ncbi:hypothetical protein N5U17_02155 [Aliarcobacter butzleri]|uniref:hypothetical protein n=1 Tax=Aliarcobacter butzleri TaxID=28197 RepID=UPI0021B391D2|nr:hypothetical protein [Aliarcobacter butzleri]MCT7603020.1 hypothetical protein [Aliarcobacter butzleri]
MTREKIMVDLFGFSAPTYYKWTKHQKRKIFDLLDYAFTQKELEEYLTTNRIKRVDKQHDFDILEKSVLIFLTNLAQETRYYFLNEIIELLVEHYIENSNSISLELFAEKIYSKFQSEEKIQNHTYTSKIKYKIIEIFKNENLAILNYICKNYSHLENNILKIIEDVKKEEAKRDAIENGYYEEEEDYSMWDDHDFTNFLPELGLNEDFEFDDDEYEEEEHKD